MPAIAYDSIPYILFFDPTYPTVIAQSVALDLLGVPARSVDATQLADSLHDAQTLVLAHGSYFPKAAWNVIYSFLERGGNLIVLGGMPFTRPVRADGTIEPEQISYTQQLYLGPVFSVVPPVGRLSLKPAPSATLLEDCPLAPSSDADLFWAYYPKLTQASDHPDEMGSAGPIDTIQTPLIYATVETVNGIEPVASVATLIEQRQGRFAGGRWLLVTWQPATESGWYALSEALRRCIALTVAPPHTLDIRPALACYQPGERPCLILSGSAASDVQYSLTVSDPDGVVVLQQDECFAATSGDELRIQLPPAERPGLYRATIIINNGQPMLEATGFWVWDADLVASTAGKGLQAKRDHFYVGDKLFHIAGTTYMDSTVQRRFLALPNPLRWDQEFATMRAAGINTIRTGIWTTWRQFMPLVGFANEAMLRALDAFVLTACAHDIQLIFTFFSFSPPLFEGENPWYDPRSLRGQEAFITSITRRYKDVELLSWDLINEPSFGDPRKIFSQRAQPNYDRFEVAAFRKWLQQRYTLEELQLRWRFTPNEMPTWESVQPPSEVDFVAHVNYTESRHMLRAADFTLFSQDAVRDWAAHMREVIRASGSKTLVGMGQDESGSRPAPQFYASGVDYTTTHPWWNNDALLWDMLIDKSPFVPNLIQETGVMLARDVDGRPWRSEEEAATLLERKLYMSLAARGAGMIQWLWHTNGLMTSDNENSIGLLRTDGSVKPEYRAMREWLRFIAAANPLLLEDEKLPRVWVLVPYSQWFARPDLGIEASRRAVRTLGYECGLIPQLVGEQQIVDLLNKVERPDLIVLPGIQLLQADVWHVLKQAAEAGTTLLVSGILGRDQHSLVYETGIADVNTNPRPVRRFEALMSDEGATLQFTFGGDKIGYVKQAHDELRQIPLGAGKLIWSGLPIELSDSPIAIAQVYRQALGLPPKQGDENPLLVVERPLREGTLLLFISEAATAQSYTYHDQSFIIAPNHAGAALLLPGRVATYGGVKRG